MRLSGKWLLSIVLTGSILLACKSNNTTFDEGERIYKAYCSNCHMDDGSGLGTLMPPLANSDYLVNNKGKLSCIILKGIQGPIIVNGQKYNGIMPPAKLDEIQLHNVINYIQNSWGNDLGYTTIEEIKNSIEECER